jgi:hypothetical protein
MSGSAGGAFDMHPERYSGVGALLGSGFQIDLELGVMDWSFVFIRQQFHAQGGTSWQAI